MCHIFYCRAVGSLLYLTITTHLDIVFQIGILLQFVDNPGQVHWEGVKHIFWYLAGMRDWVLIYGMKVKGLEGFTDADSAMQEHRHVITGYTFLIDGGAISRSSKKQEIDTLSTAKSQNMWLPHTLQRRLFGSADLLAKFLNCSPTQYHFIQTDKPPLCSLVTDLITLAQNISTFGVILLSTMVQFIFFYCPTDNMVADTLTKVLSNIKAKHFTFALGLQST